MESFDSRLEQQVAEHLLAAGWTETGLLREQSILTDGRRIEVDFLLLDQLYPLAIVETKGALVEIGRVALAVASAAQVAGVPYAFLTDGHRCFEVRLVTGEAIEREGVPRPEELWSRLGEGIEQTDPRRYPAQQAVGGKVGWVQATALARGLDAILAHHKHILVSLAAEAGSRGVQAQLIWKLIGSGYARRLLYLGDKIHVRVMDHLLEYISEEVSNLEELASISLQHRIHLAAVSTFTQILDEAPAELTPDLYDLILVSDADGLAAADSYIQLFPEATIVGFTSTNQDDPRIRVFFGPPVFTYSLEQRLQAADLKPPPGFRAAQLGDVADIRPGVSDILVAPEVTTGVYVVRGKNLRSDGSIDIAGLEKIDPVAIRLTGPDGKLDERLLLRSSDILVPSWSISSKESRIVMVPGKLPGPVTFTNRLMRVRVDESRAKPEGVFTFLRSELGQLALDRFRHQSRIAVRDLADIPVFLPTDTGDSAHAKEELSAAARLARQIREEILPRLEHSAKVPVSQDDDTGALPDIGRRLQALAAPLVPRSLAESVLESYPLPIALAFRRLTEARFNIYEQVQRLRDLFEATCFFVYNTLLLDALRRLDPQVYYIMDKGARRAYNGFSMSAKLDFIEAVLNIARARDPHDLFMPELVDATFIAKAKKLQDDFRNRMSHTATVSESQQQKVLDDYRPIVESLLADLTFLSEYRLVRIPSFHFKERRGLMRRIEVYQGAVPRIDEEPLREGGGLTLADREHIVLMNNDEDILDLYPLYQLLATEETRHETHLCFFKQRKTSQRQLEGESVPGAFPLQLAGYDYFEEMQKKILDTPGPSGASAPG